MAGSLLQIYIVCEVIHMGLTEDLKIYLSELGADLVGVGDMRGVEGCGYPMGIAVAKALPSHVIRDLQIAPTLEYYDLYYTLNEQLNEIVLAGEEFLKDRGFAAYAQTTGRVSVNEKNISRLPHKTVATRAGLGWIGKNCLLVTPQYGSGIRISSLLTDAPLRTAEAVTQSRCGDCSLCVTNCPAQALRGTLWRAGMLREEIVDADKCYRKQLEIMKEQTGIETDLCGKCFAVCAYTKK